LVYRVKTHHVTILLLSVGQLNLIIYKYTIIIFMLSLFCICYCTYTDRYFRPPLKRKKFTAVEKKKNNNNNSVVPAPLLHQTFARTNAFC